MDAICRLFSSSVIQDLARKGRSALFTRLANESRLIDLLPASEPVFGLFDIAFSLLNQSGYRAEYVYKAALIRKILLGRHSLRTASMLREFRVGECKADLAILNGTSSVYEVKSERDSLSRLERQLNAYSSVFARVYVIAAEPHLEAIDATVPRGVGILHLNDRNQISTLRVAVDRSDVTSPSAIFDSIRTNEARLVLEMYGLPIPAVPNTRLSAALREQFVKLSPRKAHDGMVQILRRTRNQLPLSEFISQLPNSLQAAALFVPLRKADHGRLVRAMNTTLKVAADWA